MERTFLACRYASRDRPGAPFPHGLGAPVSFWNEEAIEIIWSGEVDVVVNDRAFCVIKGRQHPSAGSVAARLLDRPLEALRTLRGDFALAFWDRHRRRGLVARDHVGAEAIFWSARGSGMVAADEIDPLLALLPARPSPDRLAILQWLEGAPLTQQRTLFSGVQRLQPGHALVLQANRVTEQRYWRPSFHPSPGPEPAELRRALGRSVQHCLDPDAPNALLLSGGLDSGAVAALAIEQQPNSVLGVTAGFPQHPALDESDLVMKLANHLKFKAIIRPIVNGGITRAALDHQARWAVPTISWSDVFEQPLLREARRRGASTLIHGEGGDELFNPRYLAVSDLIRRGRVRQAGQWMWMGLGGVGRARSRRVLLPLAGFALAGGLPLGPSRFTRRVRSLWAERSPWLSRADVMQLQQLSEDLNWKTWPGPPGWASTAHGICTFPDALGVTDHLRRRSVWAELQSGHPLHNVDVIEMALRIPDEQTFGPTILRRPLREAVNDILLPEICWRPSKSLFDNWVVESMRLDLDPIRSRVVRPAAHINEYISASGVKEAFDRPWAEHSVSPLFAARSVLRLCLIEAWLGAPEQELDGFRAQLSTGAMGSRH